MKMSKIEICEFQLKHLIALLRPHIQNDLIQVETIAKGIVFRLWEGTAVYFPDGDFNNAELTYVPEMVGWKGDPFTIVEILLVSQFLDDHPELINGVYSRSIKVSGWRSISSHFNPSEVE